MMQLFNSLSNNVDGFAVDAKVESELVYDNCQDSSPLISIMIPTYKRSELIIDAIRSATAQVTALSFEIVIVDNDQNDAAIKRTIEVAKSLGFTNFRYYKNAENIGLYGNWNRCLQLARGKWLTILNDDDLLDSSWLEQLYAVTTEHHGVTIVACGVRPRTIKNQTPPVSSFRQIYNCIKKLINKIFSTQIRSLGAIDYFVAMPHNGSLGLLIRKDIAISIGGFDSNLYPCADYVFFSKIALGNKTLNIPNVLATYRLGDNISAKPEVIYAGVKINKIVQYELASLINVNKKILDRYIERFSVKSLSGKRLDNQPEEIKFKHTSKGGLAFRFGHVEYYIIKAWLVLLSKLYGKSI
jgi:glycosyltransferase involved in cell wall biosynthesis